MSTQNTPASSSAGASSSTPWWVRWSRVLFSFLRTIVWGGVIVNFVTNVLANIASSNAPLSKFLIISLFLAYPLYTGLSFVILILLTLLARMGSRAYGAPPSPQQRRPITKWINRGLLFVVTVTAVEFLLITPSLSPFPITLIVFGILASLSLFLLFYLQIRSGKQPSPKNRPAQPFSTPALSRRSFLVSSPSTWVLRWD
jgi:hypothetical protein